MPVLNSNSPAKRVWEKNWTVVVRPRVSSFSRIRQGAAWMRLPRRNRLPWFAVGSTSRGNSSSSKENHRTSRIFICPNPGFADLSSSTPAPTSQRRTLECLLPNQIKSMYSKITELHISRCFVCIMSRLISEEFYFILFIYLFNLILFFFKKKRSREMPN